MVYTYLLALHVSLHYIRVYTVILTLDVEVISIREVLPERAGPVFGAHPDLMRASGIRHLQKQREVKNNGYSRTIQGH